MIAILCKLLTQVIITFKDSHAQSCPKPSIYKQTLPRRSHLRLKNVIKNIGNVQYWLIKLSMQFSYACSGKPDKLCNYKNCIFSGLLN